MLEASSCGICILIDLIDFLARNIIAVERTDLTHNFFIVSDILKESDFLIKFVTY